MLKKLGVQIVVVLVGALFFTAYAQTTTVGTISGTVRDEKGAVVPKAEVSIQGEGTGTSRTVKSDDNGFYLAPSLPAGLYTVSTAPSGFKKTVATAVDLHVAENKVVNLDLQVGQVSESVEVTADAPLVETKAPALGLTVQNKEIDSLPLVDRDLYSLVMLAPGVDTTSEASDNFGTPQRVTLINGSPNSGMGAVNYNLDGGTNMNGLRNTGNPAPNPDAVEQY